MLSHGSGDCPTDGYVALNLKIRTRRLVYDGRKLQSPWGRSPEQCIQGRWRAVATAFSGQPREFLRSTVLAWNPRNITGQSPLPNTYLAGVSERWVRRNWHFRPSISGEYIVPISYQLST
jgi:hypothetical protein